MTEASVPSEVLGAMARSGGRALMLGHVHPDADVLGTLLALGQGLAARGWTVTYGGPHPPPEVLGFLPGIAGYQRIAGVTGRHDLVVLTDCPNPARTEGLLEQARGVGTTILNIDHHPDNHRYGDLNWVDPAAAATGEMVYELLVAAGIDVTPAMATNLYTAIHTDTGSFRYSNVTPRTFKIAAALTAAGAEPALVASCLYEQRPVGALGWLSQALGRVEVDRDGRVAWLTLPEGVLPEAFVEAEDLVNYPRSVGSVLVAGLFRQRGGRVKVSLRAKGEIDVQQIAARFGGGGHTRAAGCTVDGPLERATHEVLEVVRAAVHAGRGAPTLQGEAP